MTDTRGLSENSFSVISNEAWRTEKSENFATCANQVSRLRLEMTILGEPPGELIVAKDKG